MEDMYQFLELDPMHFPEINVQIQFDYRCSSLNVRNGNIQIPEVEPLLI